MKKILKIVLAVLLALILASLIKAFLVRSRQIQVQPAPKISLDENQLVTHLSAGLQIQTVSYDDPSMQNSSEFLRFHEFLRDAFPLVHSQLTMEKVSRYSLLYRWNGTDETLAPIVWMGHHDVVPAKESDWKHPPFGGMVADGYVWGRGALDDKSCVISQLEAVEYLLQAGFRPRRTIYFAYGHDEEIGGAGAAAIVRLLDSRGIKPDMVLDEGGAILDEMIPGIVVPTAMIGTSEKGYLTLELILQDSGGHSSAPPSKTVIGRLSRAVQRLEDHPMPASLQGSTAEMFDFLAPELPFLSRFVLANRWLFRPILVSVMSRVRIANATVRTTTAVTIMQGGVKENVLPSHAKATVNFRIRPGETMEDVIDHVRQTIDDDSITIQKRPQGMNPSPVSPSNSPQFEFLHRTIREIYPGVVVVPGMVIGATDARHYAKISQNVFRFAPFRVGKEDFEGVHGTNERIALNVYLDMVRFYVHFLKKSL